MRNRVTFKFTYSIVNITCCYTYIADITDKLNYCDTSIKTDFIL